MIRDLPELKQLFEKTTAAYRENFAEAYTDESLRSALEEVIHLRKVAFVHRRLGHLGDQDLFNYSKIKLADLVKKEQEWQRETAQKGSGKKPKL